MFSAWLHVHKMQSVIIFHVTLLSCVIWCRHISKDAEMMNVCAREPAHAESERNPGDGGFRIIVGDDSDLQQYVPEHVYRISITGTLPEHKLSDAYLVVVPYKSSNENATVGKFHLVDGGQMAFHVACSHIVATIDSLLKSEVHVMWTSPAHGAECVEFRATVVVEGAWYKDDGALKTVLCEEHGDVDSSKVDCCACGTAKYQLTFRSLWSHSDTYVNSSVIRWSPLIGSSHSKHYMTWSFDTLASQAVTDVCQFGDTATLERELRHQSSNIRTVIKTPGIQWTTEDGPLQQRWAHFSVDQKHHLVSVLSRLSPSPDWCVGVSAVDLCLHNCTWLADVVVQLFVWDAGVRSDKDQQNDPVQPVHHLPAHVDSYPGLSFQNGKPAEPVAVLRLQRFDPKPYDDTVVCSTITPPKDQGMKKKVDPETEASHPDQNSCVMGPWSQWSECSVTCGTGSRTRSQAAVEMSGKCSDVVETKSEPCKSSGCVGKCNLNSWSEWSACTNGVVLCSSKDMYDGSCSRRRNRSFRNPGAEEMCDEAMEEQKPCESSESRIITAFNTDTLSRCFSPADTGPCSENILRWYYDSVLSGCHTFLYGGCRGNSNRYATWENCMRTCGHYEVYMEHRNTETDLKAAAGGKMSLSGISKTTEAVETASFEPQHGVATSGLPIDCIMSAWSNWSGCSVTCGRNGFRTRLRRIVRPPSRGGKKCPRRTLRQRRCSLPACFEKSECQYTEWSSWSRCARSCGADTVQERVQRVQGSLSHRSVCPVKLQRRLCALPRC